MSGVLGFLRVTPDYFKALAFFNEAGTGVFWLVGAAVFVYSGGLKIAAVSFLAALLAALLFKFAFNRRVAPAAKSAVLITGTSTGIGAQSAVRFAQEGFIVFATVRKQADFDKVQAAAPAALRSSLRAVILDVASAASVTAAASSVAGAIKNEGLALQSVVNNAGYAEGSALETATEANIEAQFRTNVFGAIAVTNAFLPLLRAARGRVSVTPSVVFISSMVGKVSFPMMGLYCSSKHALEAIADAYRAELAVFGVNVVTVEPGSTRTEFTNTAIGTLASNSSSSASATETGAAEAKSAPAAAASTDASALSLLEPGAAKTYAMMSACALENSKAMTLYSPVSFVCEVLADAVLSPRPHARYRATPDAQIGLAVRAVAPDALFDAVGQAICAPAKVKELAKSA